jgi:putative hemolysin
VDLLIILLLIIVNGALAMSEIAVVSARKARLQQSAEAGDTRARAALELAKHPTRFLATVQIGITLVGVLAGAFGGASVAARLTPWIGRVPLLAPHSEAISLGLVVVVITYLSLVIGELAPKQLALYAPERVAAFSAQPMRWLSNLASPLVRLLSVSTELVLRIAGARPTTEPPVTPEEIGVLMAQGAQAGVFEKTEERIVKRLFRLGDRVARTLMTPRPEIVCLDLDDPLEENLSKLTAGVYTRFPVVRGSLDNVLGIVQAKDLLRPCLQECPLDLTAYLHPPLFVSETLSAFKLLEMFRETRVHTALVVDEYGSVQGLVTLNDVLEGIVGDMPAFDEPAEAEITRREDGSWLLDGMLDSERAREHLKLGALPGAERGAFHTLGGFIMMQLGRVPVAGDYFEWSGWRFEVVDMDDRRIDKVLAAPL